MGRSGSVGNSIMLQVGGQKAVKLHTWGSFDRPDSHDPFLLG